MSPNTDGVGEENGLDFVRRREQHPQLLGDNWDNQTKGNGPHG